MFLVDQFFNKISFVIDICFCTNEFIKLLFYNLNSTFEDIYIYAYN